MFPLLCAYRGFCLVAPVCPFTWKVCHPLCWRLTLLVGREGLSEELIWNLRPEWPQGIMGSPLLLSCDFWVSFSLFVKCLSWESPSSFPKPVLLTTHTVPFPCWWHSASLSLFIIHHSSILRQEYGEETDQQKRHVQFSTFAHLIPFGKSHKRPINTSYTINLQYFDKTFRKCVEVYQSTKPNALSCSKHHSKTVPTCCEFLWPFKVYTK
jgi:hypothetical protein